MLLVAGSQEAERLALLWTALAGFKRGELYVQVCELFEHAVESWLIRQRSEDQREAIAFMRDLESIQVVLPETRIQMSLDTD